VRCVELGFRSGTLRTLKASLFLTDFSHCMVRCIEKIVVQPVCIYVFLPKGARRVSA